MENLKVQSFLVFEGGGAKGLAHLGVLEHIEQVPNIKIVGFAGTSAGSIPATLAAAGVPSERIFHPIEKRSPILCEVFGREGYHPADIFGVGRKMLKRANTFSAKRSARYIIVSFAVLLALVLLWLFVIGIAAFGVTPQERGLLFSVLLFLLFGLTCALLYSWWTRSFNGLVSLDQFIENFNKVLVYQIDPENIDTRTDHITFSDLYNSEGKSLRIVATDITKGTTKVFSTIDTKHHSVAKAVAASIAIPIVFRPVEIDGNQYCDGGLVSNLPAWTFEHEHLLGPRFTTITSEVGIGLKPRSRITGLNLLLRLISIGVFGSQSLSMRGIKNHLQIQSDVDLSLLDFEISSESAAKAIETGKQAAKAKFDSDAIEIELLKSFNDHVCGIAEDLIDRGRDGNSPIIRTFYVKPINYPFHHPVALHYSKVIGFEGDPDRNASIPMVRGCIFKEAEEMMTEPVARMISDTSNLDKVFGERSDEKWLETIIRKDRKIVACCALKQDDGEVHFIGFDSNVDTGEDIAKKLVTSAIHALKR